MDPRVVLFVEAYLVPLAFPRGREEYRVSGELGDENLLPSFLVPPGCRDYEEHRS
jgi:hypothetical protein